MNKRTTENQWSMQNVYDLLMIPPFLAINIPSWIIIEHLLDKLLSPSILGKSSCRKKFSDKAQFIYAPMKAVFCN